MHTCVVFLCPLCCFLIIIIFYFIDSDCVWIARLRVHVHYFCVSFFFFFFFFQAAVVDQIFHEQCSDVLFIDPQITLFNNFFIKNGFHSTIYTFKNYFATVFSVSIFSFSKNKLNPNRPSSFNLSGISFSKKKKKSLIYGQKFLCIAHMLS